MEQQEINRLIETGEINALTVEQLKKLKEWSNGCYDIKGILNSKDGDIKIN